MRAAGGGYEVFVCEFYTEQNFDAVGVERNALREEWKEFAAQEK